jgi:predicted transcriptional regulator
MKARAAYEGVVWKLTNNFIQRNFDVGIRTFFGVQIDNAGNLLEDTQQPEFFRQYHTN